MINVIFDSCASFLCAMIMITYNESSLQTIYSNFKLEKKYFKYSHIMYVHGKTICVDEIQSSHYRASKCKKGEHRF